MFPRRSRLSRKDFPAALKRGRRSNTPHFSLSTSSDVPGYAVVVSKQVARLSTTRHRLKRQVLALLREGGWKLPPGLVVFARAGAPLLTYAEIREELEAALAKIA